MSRFDWWQSRTIEDIQEEAAARPAPEIRIPEVGEVASRNGWGFTEADLERARNELIYGHQSPPKDILISPEMYKRYEAMFAAESTKTLSPKAKKRARRKASRKKHKLAAHNKQRQGFSLETKVVPYAKADAEITTKLYAQLVGSPSTKSLCDLIVADPILRPDTAYLIGNGSSEEVVHVTNIGTKKMSDDDKKKHKGMAVRVCPEHGVEVRPATYTFDDEPADTSEVVYEDKSTSSVGYSRRYSDAYERTFGNN